MSDQQLYREIMRLAAESVGGEDELARRLRREPREVTAWLEGTDLAPFGVYVEALALLWRQSESEDGRR